MKDNIAELIQNLKGQIPGPRLGLTEDEKDLLIETVGGVRTAKSILKAKIQLPLKRIPFIFNNLDTQAVIDILHNDMTAAIKRAANSK